MARIAGVNLPLNKRSEVGLTYIYGIGRSTSNKILDQVGISRDTYVRDLTDDEVVQPARCHRRSSPSRARRAAPAPTTSSACRRSAPTAGLRHRRGMPVRGQKTKTNARTRKGPKRMQVAGKKKAGKK